MKTSNIFWGVFFVVIGGLLLLGNYTDFSFTWNSAWKFWPLVLVLIGLSILVKNHVGKLIISGLAGFILALTIYASVSATTNIFRNDFNFVFDDETNGVYDTTNFYQEYNDSIKTASLTFNGGAGEFRIIAPTEKLIEINSIGYEGNYNLNRSDEGSHSNIYFDMKKTNVKFGGNNYKNTVEMSLNSNLGWDLNFNVGASSVDLDLTSYKVSKVDIDMGAAALNLKFGDLSEIVRLKIDAGASDIDILIPENVGCEIKSDAALSSKNYEGFNKINKDVYRTENFNNSVKKIYIDIDCGVSSIDVKKY
jgi:hypothetical protein